MADAFTGEIRLFAGSYPPQDWQFCNGQIINIQQNPALFALLGITYGGDGRNNFALPDLRGMVPMGTGQGSGLTPRRLGDVAGSIEVNITTATMPPHTHPINGRSGTAFATGKNDPKDNLWRDGGAIKNFAQGAPDTVMAAGAVNVSCGNLPGDNLAHNNIQPCVGINYIICTNGYFPAFD